MQQTVKNTADIAKKLSVGGVKRFTFKDKYLNLYGDNRIICVESLIGIILNVTYGGYVILRPLVITPCNEMLTNDSRVFCEKFKITSIPISFINTVGSIQIAGEFRKAAEQYVKKYTETDFRQFNDEDIAQRAIDKVFEKYYINSKKTEVVKKSDTAAQINFAEFTANMQTIGKLYKQKGSPIQFDVISDNQQCNIMECYWREKVLDAVELVDFPCAKDEDSYTPLITADMSSYTYDNLAVTEIFKKSRIYSLFVELCGWRSWLKSNCGTAIDFSIGFNREYTDEPANFLLNKREMSDGELENIDYLFDVYLVLCIEIDKSAKNINLNPLCVALRDCLIKCSR